MSGTARDEYREKKKKERKRKKKGERIRATADEAAKVLCPLNPPKLSPIVSALFVRARARAINNLDTREKSLKNGQEKRFIKTTTTTNVTRDVLFFVGTAFLDHFTMCFFLALDRRQKDPSIYIHHRSGVLEKKGQVALCTKREMKSFPPSGPRNNLQSPEMLSLFLKEGGHKYLR